MSLRSLPLVLAAAAALVAPRRARAQGDVYGSEDLSAAPKLVSAAATARLIARSLPDELRRAAVGGTVQIQFTINRDGRVDATSVEVVSTPVAALGTAARSVVERMEFVPGKKDGAPVRTRVQLPITYKP